MRRFQRAPARVGRTKAVIMARHGLQDWDSNGACATLASTNKVAWQVKVARFGAFHLYEILHPL